MPLLNPLRLEIHKRLTSVLEEIDGTGDWFVDLSSSVFRGRAMFGEGDPLPMVSILEVPIPIDQRPPPGESTYSSGGWELMVQGFAVDDRDNPTDPAHVMLADVKKRLAQERKKLAWGPSQGPNAGVFGLGKTVIGMEIGPGVVRPPDEVSAKAYFWLTLELVLAEDLEDPYQASS